MLKKVLSFLVCALFVLTSAVSLAEDGTFTGTADGFGGTITVEVTVKDGVITDLEVHGEKETPEIGGAALETLIAAILEEGSAEDVEAVTGATWTSKGVFAAVLNALGLETEEAGEAAEASAVSSLNHGLGVVVTPRLGPGRDDLDVPVYSFNVVMAYVLTDDEQRVVDMEADILEIITPNHDGAEDNVLAGWPGAKYNNDEDADGAVDGTFEQTEENFTENLPEWKTKRQLGSAYKMNSGTWEQEMDIFEAFFRGKTLEEIETFFEKHCSDRNGRPIFEGTTNEQDLAKWNALTGEEKAEMDALTGATMSLSDAHGDLLGAIRKAMNGQEPVDADQAVACLGLGTVVTPRLGPGKDDQDVPVYSFNVVMAGALFDAEARAVAVKEDILEIITPNHDSAEDNVFIGWPGQTYNSDDDGDGKVDGIAEQTEESFTGMLPLFRTKRELGNLYKMNSGTWAQEMDIFERFFAGKTLEEIQAFMAAHASSRNGRVIFEGNTNEQDLAKWNALTDEEKAEVDALTGATMSLTDAHGNLLGALEKALENARVSFITVGQD